MLIRSTELSFIPFFYIYVWLLVRNFNGVFISLSYYIISQITLVPSLYVLQYYDMYQSYGVGFSLNTPPPTDSRVGIPPENWLISLEISFTVEENFPHFNANHILESVFWRRNSSLTYSYLISNLERFPQSPIKVYSADIFIWILYLFLFFLNLGFSKGNNKIIR